MSKILGIDLYVKYEGANPTGSFKDRGMVMAVTKAKEQGKKIVICASTGNTSASAAAYAARAGLKAIVVIPEGKIALGKLSQAVMYGAEIVSIEGNFDEALEIVKEIAKSGEIELVNSVNPFRIEGQKTGSFEIVQQLDGEAPDILAIPVQVMQVILLHIGKALKNIMKLKDHNCRKCLASKLKAHHQLFKIKSLKILKRLQLLFELVILLVGIRQLMLLKNQMD